MDITLKYFGVVAETTGKTEESIELPGEVNSLNDLKSYLVEKYALQDPESIQISVNHNLNHSGSLNDGDEIALLPPFSGG